MAVAGRRGTTLVELMVAVAVLGVGIGAAGAAALWQRQAAVDAAHLERARALLDAEAAQTVRAQRPDPVALARRLESLPQGSFRRWSDGGVLRLEVTWRSTRGEERRSLALVAGAGR